MRNGAADSQVGDLPDRTGSAESAGTRVSSQESDLNTVEPDSEARFSACVEDLALDMMDDLVQQSTSPEPATPAPDQAQEGEPNRSVQQELREALRGERATTREMEARIRELQESLASKEREVEALRSQNDQTELERDALNEVITRMREQSDTDATTQRQHIEELAAQLAVTSAALETERKNAGDLAERVAAFEEDVALREKVAEAQAREQSTETGDGRVPKQRPEASTTQVAQQASGEPSEGPEPPTEATQADGAEETPPMLTAAYQQISLLNTQLAHLYTELTMARTEAQRLRSSGPTEANQPVANDQSSADGSASAAAAAADSQKQSQQIADLVSDIRHLQLDLEYHQKKLDQLISEKEASSQALSQAQEELAEARTLLEERDQQLKHKDVDLEHFRHLEERFLECSPRDGGLADAEMLGALRTEAAAKDSALIVSHYELHKEKLMRDRLEQKNVKLMERMQKLMMVVETMRKENASLERAFQTKRGQCEERDLQLREMTAKAKQLNKMLKAAKLEGGSVRGQGSIPPAKSTLASTSLQTQSLELEDSALHALGRSQRSIDSVGAPRSGMSTPRTPRTPRTGGGGPSGVSPYRA